MYAMGANPPKGCGLPQDLEVFSLDSNIVLLPLRRYLSYLMQSVIAS